MGVMIVWPPDGPVGDKLVAEGLAKRPAVEASYTALDLEFVAELLRQRGRGEITTRELALQVAHFHDVLSLGLRLQDESDVAPAVDAPASALVCQYDAHREAGLDWTNVGGRLVCGICHPQRIEGR